MNSYESREREILSKYLSLENEKSKMDYLKAKVQYCQLHHDSEEKANKRRNNIELKENLHNNNSGNNIISSINISQNIDT